MAWAPMKTNAGAASTLSISRPTQSWDQPLQDAGWRRWFDTLKAQGVDKIGPNRPVQKPVMDLQRGGMPVPTGPNAVRALPALNQRQVGAGVGSMMPPTSYGADAELARRSRQLALEALDVQREGVRLAGEPQILRQQRANIAGHGTIEEPFDFKRRTGREEAAELIDPGSPRGALAEQEFGRKLEGIYRQNVLPAQIAGESRLGVADINRDADIRVQGSRAQVAEGGDLAARRAAAMRALAAMFGFDENDLSEEDREIRRGIRGEAGF